MSTQKQNKITHTHTYIHTYTHTHSHTHTHTHTHTLTHIHTHTHTLTHIPTYIHTLTHIHIHCTHTYHPSLSNRAALAHKQHEPYDNHAAPLLTLDHYQVTLDDKIDCMATKHCHAVLSGSCNYYIYTHTHTHTHTMTHTHA